MAAEKGNWLVAVALFLYALFLNLSSSTSDCYLINLSPLWCILATVLKWCFAPSHPPLLTLPFKLWTTTVVMLMCHEQSLLKCCDLTGSRWLLSLECILPSFTYCYVCSSGYFSWYRCAVTFLVPGLHSLVIVTVHCKKNKVFRERASIVMPFYNDTGRTGHIMSLESPAVDSSWKQALGFGFVSDRPALLLCHIFIAIWDRQNCWGHLTNLLDREEFSLQHIFVI